jgi:hypothetical protein
MNAVCDTQGHSFNEHDDCDECRLPVARIDRDQEALRLWQCARALAKRGQGIAAIAYYRQCVSVIRGK